MYGDDRGQEPPLGRMYGGHGDDVHHSDSEHSDVYDNIVTDYEEWSDYNSEFLVGLYHSLKDQIAGLGVYILDACQFADFVEFCYRYSSGRKPPC
jgi:hypothetical protein